MRKHILKQVFALMMIIALLLSTAPVNLSAFAGNNGNGQGSGKPEDEVEEPQDNTATKYVTIEFKNSQRTDAILVTIDGGTTKRYEKSKATPVKIEEGAMVKVEIADDDSNGTLFGTVKYRVSEGKQIEIKTPFEFEAGSAMNGGVVWEVTSWKEDASKNYPAIAEDDEVNIDEDETVEIEVLKNDLDLEEDEFHVIDYTDPEKGTLILEDDEFTYIPEPNYHGVQTFEYTITDGDTATVTINIDEVNDVPEAKDDLASTLKNTPVTIDVLDNDSDIDGDELTIYSVDDGSNGSVSIDDNKVIYTPNSDFVGEDTFDYVIRDSENEEATAKVTVKVNESNTAPIAVDDNATTAEGNSVTIDVLANDTDAEDDELLIDSFTQGSNGSVTEVEGKLVYTPNSGFSGTDSFTYLVSDGLVTDEATVTVTVNENTAPVAVDDSKSTDEGNSVTIDVLENDTDEDDDDLLIDSFTQVSNGSVSLENGKLVYTPNPDFEGTDTFEYTVSDGKDTDDAEVIVTVNGINNKPNAKDDSISTDEDHSVTIDVLDNDTDEDDDELEIVSVSEVLNGTVEIINNELFFTPDENFNGEVTFDYTISDGFKSDSATVTVTVNSVNDAPVANDDVAVTLENEAVTIDVLYNDTDLENNDLSVDSFVQGANGVVTKLAGQLVYTPNEDFVGTDTFTYIVSDGDKTDEATVTVTVKSNNTPPLAVDDEVETDEGNSVTIDVLGNDTDEDGDILSIESVTPAVNGSVEIVNNELVYTPNPDFYGTETLTYTMSDGLVTDTAIVTITVNEVVVKHLVTFNSNGGTAVDSKSVVHDNPVSQPSNPNRTGYSFVEWRLDNVLYNFGTNITSPITLVAEWKKDSEPDDEPSPPSTPSNPKPSIKLDKKEVELEAGPGALDEFLSYDFTETIRNSNDKRVKWEIADEDIASVDSNGVVTAIGQGETVVTVTHLDSGKTDSAFITVFFIDEEINPLGAVKFFDPYVYGYPDTTFGPQRSVTRAEVATMFAKILKLNIDYPGTQVYEDVKDDAWYYAYVQAISRTGIFVGDTNGSFRPNDPITRGEIATVFAKYWSYLNITVDDSPVVIKDVQSNYWAKSYVYMMYNAGIVSGFEDGTYKPNDPTLREQVVGMINTLIARPEYRPMFTKYIDINPTHWAYGNIEAATTTFSEQTGLPVEE